MTWLDGLPWALLAAVAGAAAWLSWRGRRGRLGRHGRGAAASRFGTRRLFLQRRRLR